MSRLAARSGPVVMMPATPVMPTGRPLVRRPADADLRGDASARQYRPAIVPASPRCGFRRRKKAAISSI